jgi:NAD(P)-dependent dehydrogenase (short-subunit alcohol dehydrogenase family)
MAGSFAGKVALVTGAGSGIGRATALAFAREGAKVVAADIDADSAGETAAGIMGAGGEALAVRADVASEPDVAAMVGAAVGAFGRLDCAFNNAGIGGGQRQIHEWDLADFYRVLDVNLIGVWLCLKHELPVMAGQGGGAVVNNASVAGLRGSPGLAPYAASKHGVIGLTRTAALECASQGVRVNAVCPGFTDTPILRWFQEDPGLMQRIVARIPIKRLGRPEEVAEAVLWLCSDAASLTLGHAMVLDGGLTA